MSADWLVLFGMFWCAWLISRQVDLVIKELKTIQELLERTTQRDRLAR